MLLGWTASLCINLAGKLVECEHDATWQITLVAGHAFLHCDADLAGVILPAPQDLYLLLPGKAVMLK